MTTNTAAHPASTLPVPDAALDLESVAALIDSRLAATTPGMAIGITTVPTPVSPDAAGPNEPLLELSVRELVDGSPDALEGFTAPARWSAIGLALAGRASRLESDGAPLDSRAPSDGRLVLVVDRTGRTVTRLSFGRPADPGPTEVHGPLLDLCLRCLDLDTPPPDRSTLRLWATLWLDRVVADFAASAAPPDWQQITDRCPAVASVRSAIGDRPDPDTIAALGRALSDGYGWEELRRRHAAGTGLLPEPTAEVAAWMDAGMFARRTLGLLPDLEDLVDAVASIAGSDGRRCLREVLDVWGVTPADT